ncbi:hypothetical protein [Bacillus sp. CGMCC 1.16541]|uniref:hypothetical protein n=1 Tax=Bacillus sp. CGMCC 1.16541 TaxID=2185143 RepID=UPI000D733AB0|nr:hypothetical protein [Bacillus sp. CGMCC 1.16541]
MLILFLVIIPLLGVLWFWNLVGLLKNLHQGKDTHNQTMIGALLTFLFLIVLMYGLVGTH